MRHTFRLNVYGKGYTLFSGQSSHQYDEFPLDVVSDGISRNYLSAQKKIDAMLDTRISRWHFCGSNLYCREYPVVSYGCSLPVKDDKGRTGLSFIHAIESGDLLGVGRVVFFIAQLLSHRGIEEISHLLGGIAKGSVMPEIIIDFLSKRFERLQSSIFESLAAVIGRPFREIQHDCGGASALAWLAIALSHLRSPSPWEIYDEYSHDTGMISTVSSCATASGVYSLSDLLYQLTCDCQIPMGSYPASKASLFPESPSRVLETVYTSSQSLNDPEPPSEIVKAQDVPSDPLKALEPSTNPLKDSEAPSEILQDPHSPRDPLKGLEPPSKDLEDPKPLSESLKDSRPLGETLENPHGTNRRQGEIVEIVGFHKDELFLVKGDGVYRVSSGNCISSTSAKSHYTFTIKRKSRWCFRRQIKLILPKAGMTDQQRDDVDSYERALASIGKTRTSSPLASRKKGETEIEDTGKWPQNNRIETDG